MQICTYRMRRSWLPLVVELITFLLVSVRSCNVTLCFLKPISWSTRIFLINDEVWGVIVGGFNKCRWSESKKWDAWIKWCLYLKDRASFSFCWISYFSFDLWWNMNITFFLRAPPNRSWSFGTVVTDVLTHTDR